MAIALPPRLNLGTLSDDEDQVPPLSSGGFSRSGESDARIMQESFALSQSGTFKVKDFGINKGGLKSSMSDRAGGSGYLEVNSMDELEIECELAHGASATVFKAKHKPTGTTVAVKQVKILEKATRDQVVAELRIMRKHNLSPWLVQLMNAFYEEAKVYTVLEFMDGGSLKELIARHPRGLRDERDLGRVALQMLNGLSYLRSNHQVHRDLKPANVLLSGTGAVKISDFGISSQLANTAGMCSTFIGTTCYMAPERLSGEDYSYPSDVWSLGLILLELATGAYPYPEAESYWKLLKQVTDLPAPQLPEGDGFSDAFGEFIALCLEKSAQRRPPPKELLQHPWTRQYPLTDVDLFLAGMFGEMAVGIE